MDKETLLSLGLPELDVELPAGLGTVRVRALTRLEAVAMNAMNDRDREVEALACGMVDPALTREEVRQWQETTTAGVIQAVAKAISDLSNMGEGSGKAATKSVPRRKR